MISKDCAWMIRDIFRLAKYNLEQGQVPAVEDGIVINDEYHCIFRLRLFRNDSFPRTDEVQVAIAAGEYRGYIELCGTEAVEQIGTGSVWHADAFNARQDRIQDPFSDMDFCADWEAAAFQSNCVSADINDQLVDGLVLFNFIKDLMEPKYIFTLNTDLLMTAGEFDHNKVLAVHKYFFD